MTTSRIASEIGEGIARMIASMPDGQPDPEPAAVDPTPSYVRSSWGWGERYIQPIPLRGGEWQAAFAEARPIVAAGGILVLVGERGPGKTQMAAELARGGDWPADRGSGRAIASQRKTALYRRAMDIFLDLAHARKDHVKSSEKEVLGALAECGLLVIDEFHERGETEAENRKLANLVDKRYSDKLPTVIIANMERKQIFDSLGTSVVDRACEKGVSIEFSWPSFRREKKK
jgi:DNA replication protein DnaC